MAGMWVATAPFVLRNYPYRPGQVIPQRRARRSAMRLHAAAGRCRALPDPPGWDPYGDPGAFVRDPPLDWRWDDQAGEWVRRTEREVEAEQRRRWRADDPEGYRVAAGVVAAFRALARRETPAGGEAQEPAPAPARGRRRGSGGRRR